MVVKNVETKHMDIMLMDAYRYAGVESLDYMRLHKKYSWRDEPVMELDAIGEKYVGLNKIEYEGNLDRLFED